MDVYVELPMVMVNVGVCSELAAAGLRLKVRTGGLDADAFPSELERFASVISACVDAKVAFKLTAGLHHAVRHRALKTGFEHHGFLEICVLGAFFSRGGGDRRRWSPPCWGLSTRAWLRPRCSRSTMSWPQLVRRHLIWFRNLQYQRAD